MTYLTTEEARLSGSFLCRRRLYGGILSHSRIP